MTTPPVPAPLSAEQVQAIILRYEGTRRCYQPTFGTQQELPPYLKDIDALVTSHEVQRLASAAKDETIAKLERRVTYLESTIATIRQSVRDDEKGEQWTIRSFLDAHGIYNGNLSGSNRLVFEACKAALADAASQEPRR